MKKGKSSTWYLLWVFVFGVPYFLCAQEFGTNKPEVENSQWIIVLSTSSEIFSQADLKQWEDLSGQKPSVYKSPFGVYRAIIHTPEYWPEIKAYRDSLKNLGLTSIRLYKLYKHQFIYHRWQELEDMGERINDL